METAENVHLASASILIGGVIDMADETATGPRLLLNAEPFGFGPAAATAILAGELSPFCAGLGYFGGGHTLDLQHSPPYDTIHATTGLPDGQRLSLLRRLAPHYDLFVTAMDFEMAALARRAGLDVAVYDALAWYWPAVPPVAFEAVLYLAQDFFGVRERIAAEPGLEGRAVVVPPLIPPRRARTAGDHVLVNLGACKTRSGGRQTRSPTRASWWRRSARRTPQGHP